MTDDRLARAAVAQVQVIRASLTRRPSDRMPSRTGEQGQSELLWLPTWKQARDCLLQMRRGSVQQCATLVWHEIDLAADLSGQSWWSSPRLQRAAIGEIAWATVLGRWVENLPSAEAQRQWEAGQALSPTVRRHPSARRFGRRRVRGNQVDPIADARRRWEDAWWSWATISAFDSELLIRTTRSVPGLADA